VNACGLEFAVAYDSLQSFNAFIPPGGITDTCVPFIVQVKPKTGDGSLSWK